MSRREPWKPRRRTTITVPTGVGPHVRLIFSEMSRQNVTYDQMDEGSGVQRATLKAWRHKNVPSLQNVEAALGFLGFDLVPVPRAKALPPEVVAELKPIADRLGLSMEAAVKALVEIVAGVHAKFGPADPPNSVVVDFRKSARRHERRDAHPDQNALLELPDVA